MDNAQLSDMGRTLDQASLNGRSLAVIPDTAAKEPAIHVPNVGSALLSAYEQLRIASENIEDHLLFQSALRRFYNRNLIFTSQKPPAELASEMVIELTMAGYLKNNSVSLPTVQQLDALIAREYASYWDMLVPDDRLKHRVAQKWVLESLSVKTEQLFHDPTELLAFGNFAYQHFVTLIDVKDFIVNDEKVAADDYQLILYIAVQKSLLRSNDANVRNVLYDMYASSIRNPTDLIRFHINYDRLAALKTTAKILQIINRNGAPLRILRTSFFNSGKQPGLGTLQDKTATLALFSRRIDEEGVRLRQKLRLGIVKSVVFLLITKALIGILLEIPYDLYVRGSVATVPLVVNLLVPPLIIAAAGLSIRLPKNDNKQAIIDYLAGLLYLPVAAHAKLRPPRRVAKSRAFNLFYAVIFLAVFYFVARGLGMLGFNLLQGVIFFIFVSTASFLGYRLAFQVKEFELVPSSEGFFGVIRETFYAPFVVMGRRISSRFARLNIVAQVLDNVIELPLTTVLRLLRQWMAFLRNKQDEIGG